jgi:hypothetical protein
MSYNVGPCRDCGQVVERDVANICFECWAHFDARDQVAKKAVAGILIPGMPVTVPEEE